jgi:hypothetical protein
MEFWLNYVGELSGRMSVADMHGIRRHFHKQLKKLWECHPALQVATHGTLEGGPGIAPETRLHDGLAQRFKSHNGYSWVPLVRGEAALQCSIEILMLRTEAPGAHIASPDLDNRAKVLIDAMTIPNKGIPHTDLGGDPTADEQPFYVLLEDDKWVTRIVIEAATLLEPVDTQHTNYLQAIIKVSLKPQYATPSNSFVV